MEDTREEYFLNYKKELLKLCESRIENLKFSNRDGYKLSHLDADVLTDYYKLERSRIKCKINQATQRIRVESAKQ